MLLTLYQCPRAIPHLVNQTIDDQFGDSLTGRVPVFWPSPWANQTSSGNYALKPDVTQVYNGTYSAATYYPAMGSVGISMNFTGRLFLNPALGDLPARILATIQQELRFMCSLPWQTTKMTVSQL
jgi:hypothetical protein